MQKRHYIFITIIIFILVFLFVIVIQNKNKINLLEEKNKFYENELLNLNAEYTELSINSEEVEKKYNSLFLENKTLNENYQIKIKENKIQEQEITDITQNYNEMYDEYQTLFEEIGQFKESIEDSMNWFKTNATIENLKDSRKIKNLLKKCVDCEENECYIKTACIQVINAKELYLKYEIDEITTGKEDKLMTLEEFLEKRKGDCEDFSLFFAAELRYLIEYVNSQKKTPIIEAIVNSDTRKKYDIVDRWYYPEGVEKKILSEEFIYPYVACGNLFDPNTQENGGHCVIMLAKEKIDDYKDLKNITELELIEPQNAFYLGTADSDGIFKTEENNDEIYHIITQEDYFMHSSLFSIDSESIWYSYGYYYNKILEIEK